MIVIRDPHASWPFAPFYFPYPTIPHFDLKDEATDKKSSSQEKEKAPAKDAASTTTTEQQLDKKWAETIKLYRKPHAQLNESDDSIAFSLDLPGVKAEHAEVQVKPDSVSVTAKSHQPGKVAVYYSQQFSVNERKIDTFQARAALIDGVLTVSLPKKDAPEPFSVPVQVEEPPESVDETKQVRFSLDMPGVKAANIEVTFKDDELIISGERRRGSATSKIRRVCDVDSRLVDASSFQAFLQYGVLTLLATRKEPDTAKTVMTIPIATTDDDQPAIESAPAKTEEDVRVETVKEEEK
jgi:HSP20 family molecular chaperone IbpA